MFKELASQLVLIFVLVAVAFAWWKGERPERIGALFNGVICVGVTLFQAISRGSFGTIPILVADGVLATGFLFLAFRYARLWLAVVMVLEAGAFLIHASKLMELLPEGHPPAYYYYAAMNVASMLVPLTIIVGTAVVWLLNRKNPRLV
jgi:hypothetical protein